LPVYGVIRRGQPNGVTLSMMALIKRQWVKVVFAAAPENIAYTEGLGEFVAARIDLREFVATVTNLASA